MTLNPEEFAKIVETGVDIKNRVLFFQGDIEESTINPIIRAIYALNRVSEQKGITLYLSSDGGSLFDAFTMYDVISGSKAPISVSVLGKCCSAAPILLMGAAGEKSASAGTVFMLHEGTLDMDGPSPSASKSHSDFHVGLMDKFCTLLAKHSQKRKSFWKTKIKTEFYFSSQDALEFGLIKEIR